MVIRILGIGCPACNRMEEDVRKIVDELGVTIQIQHVRDPEAIKEFSVFSIPALVIDGEVTMVGYHGRRRIEQIIREKL